LLDVALGRAKDAVEWLSRAYAQATDSGEVAASFAHALARVGRLADAKKVLVRAMKNGRSREHAALLKWLEAGAPADGDHPSRPTAVRPRPERESRSPAEETTHPGPRRSARSSEAMAVLETRLAQGLASLPLDAKQRTRAKSLARDAMGYFARHGSRGSRPVSTSSLPGIAAAIAYAIVYVDHVPLTQAEVAACFRVSVASLRGRFSELRAHLDLTPGDARYATLRRR
jgi:hypothetical protein